MSDEKIVRDSGDALRHYVARPTDYPRTRERPAGVTEESEAAQRVVDEIIVERIRAHRGCHHRKTDQEGEVMKKPPKLPDCRDRLESEVERLRDVLQRICDDRLESAWEIARDALVQP